MGPMTLPQKVMGGTLLFAVSLWMFGDLVGVSAVVAAMMGLAILLLSGVLEWKDCLSYTPAWDTLTWFAVLIGMSNAMNDLGVISYFAGQVGAALTAMNLAWPVLFTLLHVVFFYLHYLFASQTAHVGALFAAFLALMLSAGIPPMLAVLTLSFNVRPSVTPVSVCPSPPRKRAGALFRGAALSSVPQPVGLARLKSWLLGNMNGTMTHYASRVASHSTRETPQAGRPGSGVFDVTHSLNRGTALTACMPRCRAT